MPDIRRTRVHECLAARASVKGQANRNLADLSNTFEKKTHLFVGKTSTFTPLGENVPSKTEAQLDIQTGVDKELEWITPFIGASVDMSLQLAVANNSAKADLVLGERVLIENVPALCLLELEQIVNGLLAFAAKIPTLDPAKGFTLDQAAGEGIYRARMVEKTRTFKTQEPVTMAPATEKHAAQVTMLPVDKVIGYLREDEWSSCWTPARKAATMSRIEDLGRAVKRARMRACEALVDTSVKPGDALVRYALFGV